MKAIVTLTAGLMIISATFAQSSRRGESKENNSESNNKRTESVSTERRTPSERSDNSRTESSSSSRRSVDNNSVEKKSEVNNNAAVQQPAPVTPDRSSATNRRNPSEQNRTESYSNSNRNSTQSSGKGSDNNRPSQNSVKTYDDNRREPHGDRRNEVVVQQHSRRTVEPRHHAVVHKSYRPVPVEVRRVKYPYRAPVRSEVIWTIDLSRRFEVYYPAYRPYRYHVGMRLASVSAYDAYDFVGEIARVYGRVAETYYARETDEFFLYLGDYYPYHDFAVIVPGREARDFSRRPERYFERQYIEVTGLITRFEGKPEMVIKRSSQIGVY